jgi:hypothetical protein
VDFEIGKSGDVIFPSIRGSVSLYRYTGEYTRTIPMDLKARLLESYGPLVSGSDLARLAGFKSTDALRVAEQRGRLGFHVFRIDGRKGRFARVEDVATWIESQGIEHDKGEVT